MVGTVRSRIPARPGHERSELPPRRVRGKRGRASPPPVVAPPPTIERLLRKKRGEDEEA